MTFVIIVCAAAALVLLISYICVRETFYVRSSGRDEPKVPHEKQYIEVSDKIMGFINSASAIGYEDVYTEDFTRKYTLDREEIYKALDI